MAKVMNSFGPLSEGPVINNYGEGGWRALQNVKGGGAVK